MKSFITFLLTLAIALALWTPPEEKKAIKEKTYKIASDFYSWSKSLSRRALQYAEDSKIVKPVHKVSDELSDE